MARQPYSKKLVITLVAITCLEVIITSIIVAFYLQGPSMSDIMDNYAQTLISDYNQNINFFLPSTYSYFLFHSNLTYTAKTIISSDYGTALLLYPADAWSFNNTETTQRIEEAVLGENNFNFLTQIIYDGSGMGMPVHGGYGGENRIFVKYIGFTISPNCSVIFRNININSVPYFFLILKGSNEASSWSDKVALNDSRLIFDDDLYFALNNSEAMREYYAEPELDTLLVDVLTKWHNQLLANGTITYTYSQKEYDIEQIEELAKTKYGITDNDFINRTLTYLESVPLPAPTPTKTMFGIKDSDNWIFSVTFGSYIVLLYALFSILRTTQRKYPNEDLKFLTGILLDSILISVGVAFFVLNYPYGSQLAISQIAVVFGISTFGVIGLYKAKKKLATWRLTKANKANSPDKET